MNRMKKRKKGTAKRKNAAKKKSATTNKSEKRKTAIKKPVRPVRKSIWLQEAEELGEYLTTLAVEGIPREYTNVKTGEVFGNVMVDDFGDYIPFMYWLGKLTNKKYCAWAKEKAMYTLNHFQMPNGLLCTSFKERGVPEKNNNKTFNADKMSDAVLGMNLMHELTEEKSYATAVKKFFAGLSKHMTSGKGFVYYKKHPLGVFPFSMGKYCGLYIEEAVKHYEATQDERALQYAKKLAKPWINDSFFKKTGLFPFKCTIPAIKPFASLAFKKQTSFSFNTAMLTKSNTNLLFGLTRLQAIIEDEQLEQAVLHWSKNVEKKLLTKENIFKTLWPGKTLSYLGSDHAAIDALAEVHIVTGSDQALQLAITATEGWLKLQSQSGLIPETPYHYNINQLSKMMRNPSMAKPGISRLDSQTDFGVMLLRIHELTGEEKYRKAALKIAKGIITHHKHGKGFTEFVDVNTHKQFGHVIETKFLFLLLKFFLALVEVDKGIKIYKTPWLKDMVRDR
jgi:uncharacterized protein YyaL (SSP411 family)